MKTGHKQRQNVSVAKTKTNRLFRRFCTESNHPASHSFVISPANSDRATLNRSTIFYLHLILISQYHDTNSKVITSKLIRHWTVILERLNFWSLSVERIIFINIFKLKMPDLFIIVNFMRSLFCSFYFVADQKCAS